MNVWDLPEDTDGASQPVLKTYLHGASQPDEQGVAKRVGLRVVSFNFGMPQSMLESTKRWNTTHVFTFRNVLNTLGQAADNDFVFGSEVGGVHEGLRRANVDFQNIVSEALPRAECSSSGAYLHIWNIGQRGAALVRSGTWKAPTSYNADVRWQAFELTYRDSRMFAGHDASQLEDPKVGLLAGNMQIPVGGNRPPSIKTRRRIVHLTLEHLAQLEVDAWRGRPNFPVLRLLVGDCNLKKTDAQAATQKLGLPHRPPPTRFQQDFGLRRWQVCDVQFPRQALASTRRQYTKKQKYLDENNKKWGEKNKNKIISKRMFPSVWVRL